MNNFVLKMHQTHEFLYVLYAIGLKNISLFRPRYIFPTVKQDEWVKNWCFSKHRKIKRILSEKNRVNK